MHIMHYLSMFNLFHNLLIHHVCGEMQIEEIRGNSQGEVQAHQFHMVIYYSLHEFFYKVYMDSCTQILSCYGRLYRFSFLHDLNRIQFGFWGWFFTVLPLDFIKYDGYYLLYFPNI